MSNLHKQFLRKIKEQERAFGLSLLSEEPNNSEPETGFVSVEETSEQLERLLVEGKERQEFIRSNYQKVKGQVFPIANIYTDSQTGLQFQTYLKPPSSSSAPIFICHHGAGSSSMTFCKLAQDIDKAYGGVDEHPGLFTYDARGHGSTPISTPADYSLSTMTKDFEFIINEFHKIHNPQSSIYLVGHSLGGSILTNYLTMKPDTTYNFKGLIILDIVEETAVKALAAMPSFISRRPTTFNNYQEAIDWHIDQTRLLHSSESALLSVPDLLDETPSGLIWKTNLSETQPFWDTWFVNLSTNFIDCGKNQHVAKMLILSGHETLDTGLIIGQMQGKYQLIVFNNNENTGHFIHEDISGHISHSLIDFVKRNDSPGEYMKKEFGFVPKWGGKIHN